MTRSRYAVALAVLLGAVLAVPLAPLAADQPPMPPMPAPIAAPTEPDAIPLYGAATPGSAASENWAAMPGGVTIVRNVTRPTLTPVLPAPGTATGAAVVIAPGGAFMLLAMDHEGWAVARALAARGIAAFVLKYRVLSTPVDTAKAMAEMQTRTMAGLPDPTQMPTLQFPAATEDGLAALAMVRANAARWGIDPARVGMMGFSAGAMTTLNVTLAAKRGERPAFAGYIYGPQARIAVPADASPLFDAIALDDPLFPWQGFPIAQAWAAARRSVEIHGFQRGGHGFGGLGTPGTTTTLLLDEFVAWLRLQGMLDHKG